MDDNLRIRPAHRLMANDATVAAVNYIKMDIEGSEAEALTGAHETITRFRPKLAVCLYHNPTDLWTIPAALKRQYPFYQIYLAHHSLHAEETVLYAIDRPD